MPDPADPDATIPLKRTLSPVPGPTIVLNRDAARRPGALGGGNPDAPVDYLFGEEIARGGMGSILQAEDCKLPRTVAVKIILSEIDADEDQKQRFINEAAVLAKLAHPNIVPVYDIGRDQEGQLYYSMKLVKGRTLKAILSDVRDGITDAAEHYTLAHLLTIFRKVCDAMAFAHSKGIIHRDLKPENIMVGEFGEVLVMDWGLAKVLESSSRREEALDLSRTSPVELPSKSLLTSSATGATLDGSVMGTPQYMSPEQAEGRIADMDARSDIFSLGGILYCILTLRPPVEGKTLDEVLQKVISGNITAPSAFGASTGNGQAAAKGEVLEAKKIKPLPHCPAGRVPPALSAVAMKALSVDKAKRYQSVEAFSGDIEAYQNGFATSAENAGTWKLFKLFLKRHKTVSIATVILLLVLAAFVTNVIRSERRMAVTLADLRRTAPVFFAQAKIVLEEGNLDDALEKIGYAIQLDDANADYHLFRAHLRQSAQDLAPAAEGYRRVLALRPEEESAKLNLALCEKLLRESGGGTLQLEQQRQLLAALRTQKRLVESAPLAALIDPNTATAKAALLARLREYQKQPGWKDNRVSALPDGTFKVQIEGLAIGDLSVLQGQPVSELSLEATSITDLRSLTGLPLKDLNLRWTKVSDLTPLRGMPLESLQIQETPVTDLSPLRGMKLRKLNVGRTGVSDLSPLAGMPLTDLDCFDAKSIADLAPLKGAPLISFRIRRASRVSSIVPLGGAPLKVLYIVELPVSDISPLAQCPDLEDLTLTKVPVTDLTPLAKLPITRLDCDTLGKLTELGPLRGMPLRFLRLSHTSVTDLRPLADCPALEELILPAGSLDPTPLRHLPKLRRLSTRSVGLGITPAQTAEEFWKEYDAQQAAGKK